MLKCLAYAGLGRPGRELGGVPHWADASAQPWLWQEHGGLGKERGDAGGRQPTRAVPPASVAITGFIVAWLRQPPEAHAFPCRRENECIGCAEKERAYRGASRAGGPVPWNRPQAAIKNLRIPIFRPRLLQRCVPRMRPAIPELRAWEDRAHLLESAPAGLGKVPWAGTRRPAASQNL